MPQNWLTIGLLGALALSLIVTLRYALKNRDLQTQFEIEQARLVTQYESTLTQLQQLTQDYQKTLVENTYLNMELTEIKVRFEESQKQTQERQTLLVNSEKRLTEQFEHLALKIFSNSHQQMNYQNQQTLTQIVSPLKEQLNEFKKQVQDSFSLEAKERYALKNEIHGLQTLNANLAKEALNLTEALKGNKKLQGNWGEAILNQILNNAGLRLGYEYEVQKSFTNEQNQRYLPDVIVHLPQGGDVIIDSKVSLNAYERYFNCDDSEEQKQHQINHLNAIKNHIKQLSSKEYHKLNHLKSLDYVLMFIPIESAIQVALDLEPQLINDAATVNIMIVTPNSLLIALRTISNLWRYEHQNQNALEIAERAGKLYDKIRGLAEELDSLGAHLHKADHSYHSVMNRLVSGRNNVINQIEQFREMGVSVKKPLNQARWDEIQKREELFNEEQIKEPFDQR